MELLNGDMANQFNESYNNLEAEQEWDWHNDQNEKQKIETIKLNIMVKSKVEKIVGIKPWTGANGTVYYHSLLMDNGDKISLGKKKELAIGEELTYEILETGQQEYNKAKAINPEFQQGAQSGGKKDDYVKGIEVGHAINNAVNLICAGAELDIKECKSTEERIYESAKVIMAIAHRLKSEQ